MSRDSKMDFDVLGELVFGKVVQSVKVRGEDVSEKWSRVLLNLGKAKAVWEGRPVRAPKVQSGQMVPEPPPMPVSQDEKLDEIMGILKQSFQDGADARANGEQLESEVICDECGKTFMSRIRLGGYLCPACQARPER